MKNYLRIKILMVIILVAFVLILMANSIPLSSVVEGKVKDVFGDPLPQAKVKLGSQTTYTDEIGFFNFEDQRPGLYRLIVEIEGYEKYDYDFLAELGRNHIEIREENGLKPTDFSVDFHVFYAPTYDSGEQLFVYVGLYNGKRQKITIERITLLKPNGHIEIELVEEPFVLGIFELKRIEVVGINEPVRQGTYHLEVEYKEKDETKIIQLYDTAQFDDDWDPHT